MSSLDLVSGPCRRGTPTPAFKQVGERTRVENVCDGVAHLDPHLAEDAVGLNLAASRRAGDVGGPAGTGDWRERAIHQSDDFSDGDLGRLAPEGVSAVEPSGTANDALRLEIAQEEHQVLGRYTRSLAKGPRRDDGAGTGGGQFEHDPDRVVAARREVHGPSLAAVLIPGRSGEIGTALQLPRASLSPAADEGPSTLFRMPTASAMGDPGLSTDNDDADLLACLGSTQDIDAEAALRALIGALPGGLPPLMRGDSWSRLRRLAEVAAVDLSLGRLYEGHEDARSICLELGASFDAELAWGTWAAGGSVRATAEGERFRLNGERHYCSGAGIIDAALVAATSDDRTRLFAVDCRTGAVMPEAGSWPATGMAASASATVRFADAPACAVGGLDAYEQRPGFWVGSLNVAACWYGGALGIYRWTVANRGRSDDRQSLGAMRAEIAVMRTLLQSAGQEVDAMAGCGDAFTRAMVVRHAIHDGCRRVLALGERLGGSDAIARDASQSRRFADLPVYLSQHRPFRDLASIAPTTEDQE